MRYLFGFMLLCILAACGDETFEDVDFLRAGCTDTGILFVFTGVPQHVSVSDRFKDVVNINDGTPIVLEPTWEAENHVIHVLVIPLIDRYNGGIARREITIKWHSGKTTFMYPCVDTGPKIHSLAH